MPKVSIDLKLFTEFMENGGYYQRRVMEVSTHLTFFTTMDWLSGSEVNELGTKTKLS